MELYTFVGHYLQMCIKEYGYCPKFKRGYKEHVGVVGHNFDRRPSQPSLLKFGSVVSEEKV
jgi:hypothetical protein